MASAVYGAVHEALTPDVRRYIRGTCPCGGIGRRARTRERAQKPKKKNHAFSCKQLHDFVLFMANTGLRPDEAFAWNSGDVAIVKDHTIRGSGQGREPLGIVGVQRRNVFSVGLAHGARL
jgi:integrase